MNTNTGSNIQDVKLLNRLLVLKHISTQPGISRIDISRNTGLTKMTVGNIVTELLSSNLIEEITPLAPTSFSGRKPIGLALSASAPCICGMVINRNLCQVILSDLGGNIFFQTNQPYQTLHSSQELLDILEMLFQKCKEHTNRRILAIGLASVGPLDSRQGVLLNPPSFYGIQNIPIVSILQDMTGLPAFLVNDAIAGAFAEKMFGHGTSLANFAFLHIAGGIGSGFILNSTLYEGDAGQSGEIGHTSINFNGPVCSCGNRGCLELYANLENMRQKILSLAPFYPASPLGAMASPEFVEILTAANRHDPLAFGALEEYCSYISYALANTLKMLNLSTVIVGYTSNNSGSIIEKLLSHKLNSLSIFANQQEISVVHSSFDNSAPLIGSVAIVIEKIFSRELSLHELEQIVG